MSAQISLAVVISLNTRMFNYVWAVILIYLNSVYDFPETCCTMSTCSVFFSLVNRIRNSFIWCVMIWWCYYFPHRLLVWLLLYNSGKPNYCENLWFLTFLKEHFNYNLNGFCLFSSMVCCVMFFDLPRSNVRYRPWNWLDTQMLSECMRWESSFFSCTFLFWWNQ